MQGNSIDVEDEEGKKVRDVERGGGEEAGVRKELEGV